MKRRQWAIIGGAIIIALALAAKSYLADSAKEKAPISRNQIILISYQDLSAGEVPIQIPIDGPVQAINKIEIYSEVSGIVSTASQKFEAGQSYAKGEALLVLDNSEALSAYRSSRVNFLSLLAQVLPDLKIDYPDAYAAYYQYLQKLNAGEGLPGPPQELNDKLKLFLSGRGFYSAFQSAEAARVRLEKFIIRAPFTGTLTQTAVEAGQLVRAGQPLGEYIGEGAFEMLCSVSPQFARMIKVGDSVNLMSSEGARSYQGVVARINEKLDPSTQSLGLFVRLSADDLKDGEYLRGYLQGQALANAMLVERKLLMDENRMFTIADSTLEVLQLEILHSDPEHIIFKAPANNLRVPAQKIPGAYPGMKVRLAKASAQ